MATSSLQGATAASTRAKSNRLEQHSARDAALVSSYLQQQLAGDAALAMGVTWNSSDAAASHATRSRDLSARAASARLRPSPARLCRYLASVHGSGHGSGGLRAALKDEMAS